jgi:hypothetical protein
MPLTSGKFDPALFDPALFDPTGAQKAILYARSGYARSGATRSGYFLESLKATIGGVDRSANFWKGSTKIRRILNDQPNVAYFRVFGFEPALGAEVILGNGSIGKRMFGGFITDRKQPPIKQSGSVVAQHIWDVECSDWIWELAGAGAVLERYTDQPAHLIFRDLATKYAPGYSLARVKTGSPVISEIAFDMCTLPQAFSQLAKRCVPTWHWDCDPDKILHFFDTEPLVAQPRPVTPANLDYEGLSYADTYKMARTRIVVEGGGCTVTAPVAAGATSVPVDECGWFTGDRFKSGSQICSYTGRSTTSGPGNITGIPASGDGAILYPLLQGDKIAIIVIVDDVAAQSALAAATGTNGIRIFTIRDGSIGVDAATARAYAELALFNGSRKSGGYTSHDKVVDAGRFATISLPNRSAGMTSLEVPITEVEITWENPHRTKRVAKFDSAVKIDITDVIRSAGGPR